MMALDYFSFGHPLASLRSRYALAARKEMFSHFMEKLQPTNADTVLDLGATPDTSLEESNFFERWYPFPSCITVASIENIDGLATEFPMVKLVNLAPGKLPFFDREFDLLFCSAVIEHVGSRAQQREFLSEALRVSRRFFFSTPNRWFPIEFHTLLPFIHWLPQPAHQAILRVCGYEFLSRTENLNLLDKSALYELFEGIGKVRVEEVKLFGCASNLMAYGESV